MSGFKLRIPSLTLMGHDAPSDPELEPDCGYFTHDELAILYATLTGWRMQRKTTVEIGARFGWTAKCIHLATHGAVICIDPVLKYGTPERARFIENLKGTEGSVLVCAKISREFFEGKNRSYSAFLIDGNHDTPEPWNDAVGCLKLALPDAVIVFHDMWGKPIQDAVEFLVESGFRSKLYCTPNGMAVCWRGFEGWEPPGHEPDPKIDWTEVLRTRAPGWKR